MGNLFKKAKTTATTTKAKEQKVSVVINDSEFFDKVKQLESLQENMKRDKAIADMIYDEIKDVSKNEWIGLYDKTGKNPGSILIESESDDEVASLMFVPSDKYITITPARAEELSEKFGEEVIEETTTFSFDAVMIEKYGEVLSELIENSNDIDDRDKDKIIKAFTKFSIAKGMIDNLKKVGDVQELVEEVKPVFSLKNVEVKPLD